MLKVVSATRASRMKQRKSSNREDFLTELQLKVEMFPLVYGNCRIPQSAREADRLCCPAAYPSEPASSDPSVGIRILGRVDGFNRVIRSDLGLLATAISLSATRPTIISKAYRPLGGASAFGLGVGDC